MEYSWKKQLKQVADKKIYKALGQLHQNLKSGGNCPCQIKNKPQVTHAYLIEKEDTPMSNL